MQEFLEGRTCLLTGASRGIGKSILNNLLEIGVNVIVTSKNESILRSICKDLTSFKSQIDIIPANLADVSEVNQLCQLIEERRYNIDIIINNAGILDFRLLNDFEDKDIIESFMINVQSPMIICRNLMNNMIKNKWGRIINICSSSAYFGGGSPGHCVYASTKHALLGFSRALDEELRQYNIRVGTVSPAGVKTDMVKNRKDIDPESLMSPEQVADAVMFLLKAKGNGIVYELYLHRLKR